MAKSRVLIPSSSGQSFNRQGERQRHRDRLNPFFIRSIVQCHRERPRPGERGLNPFFIRSIVQ